MKNNKDEKITFRLSSELKEGMEKVCEDKDIPMSQFIREAIKEKTDKDGKRND